MKKSLLIVLISIVFVSIGFSQITKTQVGHTRYDLQTNNSIERRIVLDPITNELVIVYTGSADLDNGAGSFNGRGTGYFYYSGIGAITPITAFPGRIEGADRTGWPNPIFLPNGFEAIIAHRASSAAPGLAFAKRKRATPTWALSTANSGDFTWPRMANTGDSIFAITSTLSGNINGMSGGVGFMRSYNGGSTWVTAAGTAGTIDSVPGINPDNYPNSGTANVLGGDEYALDVKGQKVAILTGALDVTLNYSTNFGATWTRKVLIAGDNNTTDTLPSDNRSSGDFSVLIDNNGKIHCFWGQLYGNNFTNTLARAGIMYWSEYMAPGEKPKLINRTMYEKEAGTHALINLPFFTTQVAGASINQSTYGSAHTSQPSSGIDNAGVIYLSYMKLRGISDTNRFIAGKNTDATGMLLNDCYLIKSIDSGKTWIGPINVSNSDSMESAFPSIARDVNGFVHMAYQEDPLYGFAINSTTPGHNGNTSDNKIIYAKVPVADIVNSPDITPPILRLHDSFFIKTKFASTFGTDTFVFYNNCVTELKTGLTFEELKKYLAWGMDNIDEGNVLYIDTPTGLKFNVAGFYKYSIYAKDAAGNLSSGSFTQNGSRDTFKFVIQVIITDTTKPQISLVTKLQYVYKGDPYTLPSSNFTASDDNPCGSVSVTSPSASLVDVNTVGLYQLPYTAKDAANNVSRDTLRVYVGVVPTPIISEESIRTTGSKKELLASAKTSLYTKIFTEDQAPTYQWKVKRITPALTTNVGRNKDTIIENVTTRAFDSVCLDISNEWTTRYPAKKTVKCVLLKNVVASVTSANSDVSVEIYPNPNNGTFNVKINGNRTNSARLVLTNIDGRTVIDQTVKVLNGEVPFNAPISKGIYFMTTEIDGNIYMDKVEIK